MQKILDVEREVKESIKQIERSNKQVSENTQRVIKIEMNKLEESTYKLEKAKIDEEIETNRLAIRDNFSQLLATDNFLEKYMPFRIQNLISESLLNLLGDDRIGKTKRMQNIDKGAQELIEKFRQ